MKPVSVRRLDIQLKPSQERVLIRPFMPDDENRLYRIIARVTAMDDDEARTLLEQVLEEFGDRHYGINDVLLENYHKVRRWTLTDEELSEERKMLIGAYFTQEYSLESAALFNPSIVPHPVQTGLSRGDLRFVMSLRATGEGHISSIVFREGVIDKNLNVRLENPTPFVTEPDRKPNQLYDKGLFRAKLAELDLDNQFSRDVLANLPDRFTLTAMVESVEQQRVRSATSPLAASTAEGMLVLAYSNYEVRFQRWQNMSERAIFPTSPSQRNGIEDARFVQFREPNGRIRYYATYTAFDGRIIIPQLLETDDFLSFRFFTLNGPAVKNKGMALFPRRVNGCYAMLSRQDNENLYVMYSTNIHFWYKARIIMKPTYSWEYVQLGNCGSPIELDEGWLVLSHGVGPMRKYCMGAFLLDKKDPSRVIGRLSKPLLKPNENEREGYVPNVVYTCGALVHNRHLVLPYAMSDYASGFCVIPVNEILGAMG
ncbi:MAG: glycosidase [Chitinivibrionales bacterium]|nr:glycosidase [Chitinivibrionales bacterium]